jgi:hypothetical protein
MKAYIASTIDGQHKRIYEGTHREVSSIRWRFSQFVDKSDKKYPVMKCKVRRAPDFDKIASAIPTEGVSVLKARFWCVLRFLFGKPR